jgi:hypothetical protein
MTENRNENIAINSVTEAGLDSAKLILLFGESSVCVVKKSLYFWSSVMKTGTNM